MTAIYFAYRFMKERMKEMSRKGMKAFAVLMSGALALSMAPAGVTQAAKTSGKTKAAKKVKLSTKKLTVTVGKKKTLKLKNNKKKVKWTVTSGKARIKLKSKKKTSVVIVGKKAGTAKVQAKVGKKKYTCKVSVKAVKKATKPTATKAAVTKKPANTQPTAKPTATQEPEILTGIAGKNTTDVNHLRSLIRTQLANGATVSTNLDDATVYKWDASGKLTEIYWGEKGIVGADMADFNEFTSLKVLDVNNNKISSTFYTNKLENLQELKCYGNQIDKLVIGNNTSFVELDCHNNKIANDLDLSKNKNLKRLYCSQNRLAVVNVEGCEVLEDLDCSSNSLVELQAGGLKNLTDLNCSNNQLKGDALNIADSTALVHLDCSQNCSGEEFLTLNLTGFTNLESLNCSGKIVEDGAFSGEEAMELNLSDCTKLTELNCSYCPLDVLDVSGLEQLEVLNASGCNVSEVYFSGNSKLKNVNLAYNMVDTLEFPESNQITTLDCSNSETLTEINTTVLKELETLYLSDSSMPILDLSACTKLQTLQADWVIFGDMSGDASTPDDSDTADDSDAEDEVIVLDLSANAALKEINLDSTNVTSLVLPANDIVETLIVAGSDVSQFTNLEKQVGLKILNIADCEITQLDLKANVNLQQVTCTTAQKAGLTGVSEDLITIDDQIGGDDDLDDGDDTIDDGDDSNDADDGDDSDSGDDTDSSDDGNTDAGDASEDSGELPMVDL